MSNRDDEPLFIAEISANHLGSLNRAKELVFAASESGATSVKFQTYTADTMTLNTDKFKVSEGHELWGGRTLYSLYQEAFTPWEWHEELFELSRSLGLIPFSSPFDSTAVEFLEGLGAPMYKIASLETSDHALIRKCAETGKPLIVSTGATMWDEITDLVGVVRETGNQDLTLLVCTSSYPARAEDANLNRIHTLREHFGVKVGISDHTLGSGVATAAIALGAVAIEKHLTLKRSDGGADSAFSMEPNEFLAMVEAGKQAAKSLGNRDWEIQPAEFESRRLRRSLYIVKDVKKGEKVTSENIRAIRPGAGASAALFADFLGKTFAEDFSLGTPLEINSVTP
jgi:N-acetylneuraminate synthase